MSNTPLFWSLSPATQAALMQFQWDHYGEKLNIPLELANGVSLTVQVEGLEEIAREMSKPPKSPRRLR